MIKIMMIFFNIKNFKISFKFFFYCLYFLFSFRIWSETVPSSPKMKIPDKKVEFKEDVPPKAEPSNLIPDSVQNEAVQSFDPLPPELEEDSVVAEEVPQVVEENLNIQPLDDSASIQPTEGELESSSTTSTQTVIDDKVGRIKQLIPVYTYDPLFRKDPFSQPKKSEIPTEAGIHPIEDENVDDLKLRAIIWSRDGVIPRALFETKSGKTYTLSKNDRLKGGSIIYRVDSSRVWYMQPFVDPTTKQLGYKPNDIALSSQGGEELWYER